MKAVLCLWAREHLKGRPGPGSGLARLLKKKNKKKNTTLSSVYVRVCVCVFGKERQNRTAVPGYSWQRHSEEQTELSMLRREEGWKNGFTGTKACWSPLTCRPAAGASGQSPHSEVQQLRGGVWRRDEDAEEEMKHPAGIIVLKDYEGQEKDFSWLFSSSAPLLGRLGGEHLTAEGHFTCMDRLDYYLSDTWEGCCCGLLQVRPFAITVLLSFICAKWT